MFCAAELPVGVGTDEPLVSEDEAMQLQVEATYPQAAAEVRERLDVQTEPASQVESRTCHCGTVNLREARYCRVCGYKFSQAKYGPVVTVVLIIAIPSLSS